MAKTKKLPPPKAENYPSIADCIFEESLCTEKIIWLTGCMSNVSQTFSDFLEDESMDIIKELLTFETDDFDDQEEVLSKLAQINRLGFLVEVSTPVPVAFHDDGVTHGGFGHTTSKWFYTEALDVAFLQKVIEWKQAYYNRMQKRLEAGE